MMLILLRQYGAGLVESSLSSISRPLANNLQLGQLDEFACRQLDRLGGTSPGELPKSDSPNFRHNILDKHGSTTHASRDHDFTAGEETTVTEGNRSEEAVQAQQVQQAVAVVSRSRWQTVLLEAGGLGAAVSEESLKSLRYCLQWLLVRRIRPFLGSDIADSGRHSMRPLIWIIKSLFSEISLLHFIDITQPIPAQTPSSPLPPQLISHKSSTT